MKIFECSSFPRRRQLYTTYTIQLQYCIVSVCRVCVCVLYAYILSRTVKSQTFVNDIYYINMFLSERTRRK